MVAVNVWNLGTALKSTWISDRGIGILCGAPGISVVGLEW